ncbi:hypothetical protein D9758_004668 [Tetrapyrgos nigripes]|uniref:Uncharacterized protein n=1 Tax=Tetrapyrgos nigripes TaxID=182062 RepID=A0A8H5H080_9AGAR|nr:hypothetical protein D9758_004668 [Tetrapyrgos nigripes]
MNGPGLQISLESGLISSVTSLQCPLTEEAWRRKDGPTPILSRIIVSVGFPFSLRVAEYKCSLSPTSLRELFVEAPLEGTLMPFPPDEAKLVSIFIQTLLYGAYVVVFGLTVWILAFKGGKRKGVNQTMLAISIVMFTLATMHIGVNYTRIIRAFIDFKDQPGGPPAYFNQLSEFTQIFGSAIYVAQTLVGDSVVLYRCYLVWNRNILVVLFPLMLLFGSTASGIGILYSFAKVVPQAEIFVDELQQWIVSFFSLTLATNLICTGLVAYRIWYINHLAYVFSLNARSLQPIMLLVIESGMAYSLTLTALLILYKAESWFQYVLLDAISPIVGLVFSMIIVRIGLGITAPSGETRAVKDSVLVFRQADPHGQSAHEIHLSVRSDTTTTMNRTSSTQLNNSQKEDSTVGMEHV